MRNYFTRRSLRRTIKVLFVVTGLATSSVTGTQAHAAALPPVDESMTTWVNYFRAQSGLGSVVNDLTLSEGARLHSCWMLQNGIAHDELPGTPGYTAPGDAAGNAGNVAVSTVFQNANKNFVSLWMTGPLHAIGLLRSGLTSVGSGRCDTASAYPNQNWRSAATFDVIHGLTPAVRTAPVLFPGNGSVTFLNRFVTEIPDPRSFCPGWAGLTVGLPLIALMPEDSSGATATVTGPGGPMEVCVLTRANTTAVTQAVFGADNAVVVIPRYPLVDGSYTATARTAARSVSWRFVVDTSSTFAAAALPTATTIGPLSGITPITPTRLADSRDDSPLHRLYPFVPQRLQVAGRLGAPLNTSAIVANITVAAQAAAGYLTAYPCGAAPGTSSLNWSSVAAPAANGQIIPLDASGGFCVVSNVATDVLIDATALLAPGATGKFSTIQPFRAADSRTGAGGVTRLAPGVTTAIKIAGISTVPSGALAAAVNITVVGSSAPGYLTAFPCSAPPPATSTLNFVSSTPASNNAIVALSSNSLCVRSSTASDVVVDVTGYVSTLSGKMFQAVTPTRMLDTRTADWGLSAARLGSPVLSGAVTTFQAAGTRGIPAASAVAANVTAVGAPVAGFLTAFPAYTPLPATSTLNYQASLPVSNGTQIQVSNGFASVFSSAGGHVVVDVIGVWL